MIARLRRRGPDAEAIAQLDGAVLGHCRLAIQDLDIRANQPMPSSDGRYTIVFNGEVYNFLELRRVLQADGHFLRTTSDTEVILILYSLYKERMLSMLRGMFALGIWDCQTRELFLARDPYGIKPLYYAPTAHGVVFASQVKALAASGMIALHPEPAGLAGFYLWGNIPEPWTLYRDVLALPAGHWLRVREGIPSSPVCWHDIRDCWAEPSHASADRLQAIVRHALTDTVRAHLVSDVPICVFLSGGIDSAVLTALARELGSPVRSITVRFQEFKGTPRDEGPQAAATASATGAIHYERNVKRTEFEDDIPRIMDAMDQPTIDGLNTWFASKFATEHGYRVALSGVGGDELFCGYPSFASVPKAYVLGRIVPLAILRQLVSAMSLTRVSRRMSHPKLAGLLTHLHSLESAYFLKRGLFLPSELVPLLGTDLAEEGLARLGGSPHGVHSFVLGSDTAKVAALESTIYLRNQLLRDSDWASMAHSLELRTPFVDALLLRTLGPFAADFGRGRGKQLMALAPQGRLPRTVVKRRKRCFAVPVSEWTSALPDRGPRHSTHGIVWAREWAHTVLASATRCA